MRTSGLIKISIALCLLNALVNAGLAGTTVTPERQGVDDLAKVIKMYEATHNKTLPQNWDALSSIYDLESINKSIAPRGTAPIQDRYQFLSQKLPYVGENNSRVLLIRTIPLSEKQSSADEPPRKWRYLIYQRSDGSIESTRLPEDRVQEMLKGANVTITPKPQLPSVEYEDYLPGKEPRPQPNPADVQFLSKHPELDPSRNPTASAPQPVPTVKQQSPSSFPIVPVAILAFAIVGVIVVLLRRKSP
jgi:hypothetical protein